MPTLILAGLLALVLIVAVIAVRTTGRRRVAAEPWRLIAGVVGYPVVTGLVLYGLRGGDVNVTRVAIIALPGLVFGALIGRLWITAVPAAAAALMLALAFLADPNCMSCDDYASSDLIALVLLYIAIPGDLTLLLGVITRNLVRRIAAGEPRTADP